ncbi:MAG: hypothetical protein WA151_21850, partial [Desulfatirhabdiaceae bacterium]
MSTRPIITFDEQRQELILEGTWLPQDSAATCTAKDILRSAASSVRGMLYINCKRLLRMNSPAFSELLNMLRWVQKNRPDLCVKIIVSSAIPWAERRFRVVMPMLGKNFSVEQYDKQFYPGQAAVEDASFIPVLQTQAKIIW